MSGSNRKGMIQVRMQSPKVDHILTFIHRRDLPQWYFMQHTRRSPGAYDADNSRAGKCEDGETGIWG
jgi:hypothetical protein